jgi:hypothetical protein
VRCGALRPAASLRPRRARYLLSCAYHQGGGQRLERPEGEGGGTWVEASGSAGAGAGRVPVGARRDPRPTRRRCVRLQARRLPPATASTRRRLSRPSRDDGTRVRLVGVGATRRPAGSHRGAQDLGAAPRPLGPGGRLPTYRERCPAHDEHSCRGLHSRAATVALLAYAPSPARRERGYRPGRARRGQGQGFAPSAVGPPTRRSLSTSGSSTR